MPIVKLSQNFITHDLQCPEDKTRIEYCDAELPGLYAEVRSTSPGQGTYYLRYKDITGKTCHQKIGRTNDISLAEARKKTKALKAEIALGSDPRGEEKARKAVITLTDFFDNHYLPYVKQRKRSWRSDELLFQHRIQPAFGHLQLSQITRHALQSFHAGLKEDGLAGATCDHHIKLIRHMLNLAIEWEFMTSQNPAARVPLFKEDNKVEHYLRPEELERLLAVLTADKGCTVCQITLFLMSTGARLNEALQATWAQIDRQHRTWKVSAKVSKSGRVRAIPLNDSALSVLDGLDTEGTFKHLFVNSRTGNHYTSVHKVWERLRNEAGLPQLRIHDLRHMYASFLVNSGRTLYEVQQILGHSDSKVTERYAHLSTKTLQDAANSASVVMKGAMPVSP